MQIDFVGIVYVLVLGLLLPWLAVQSHRAIEAGAPLPSRIRFFVGGILQLLLLLGLALFTASSNAIELFHAVAYRSRDLFLGAGALALFLAALWPQWKVRSPEHKRRQLQFVPRGSRESLLWLLVCLCAGIAEEVAYRGVLYVLLELASGSAWAAAVLAAFAFGVSHMIQGWKSAVLVILFALIFQGLVHATGALYVAMAVHFLYDLTAGIILGKLARKELPEASAALP